MIEVNWEQAKRIRELEAAGKTPDEAVRIVLETPVPTVQAKPAVAEKPTRRARTIGVVIPIAPPSKLFPNQAAKQAHWSIRQRLRKEYREIARYAAQDQTASLSGPVSLTLHVGYLSRRTLPDLDATISGCKCLIDGVVDAGILTDDDQIKKITATHEKLPKGEAEYTILTFSALDAG